MDIDNTSYKDFNDAKFWDHFYQPRRKRIGLTREEKKAKLVNMIMTILQWSELRAEFWAECEQWSPEYWAAVTEKVRSNPRFAPYDLTIKSYDDVIDFSDKLREERKAMVRDLSRYRFQIT